MMPSLGLPNVGAIPQQPQPQAFAAPAALQAALQQQLAASAALGMYKLWVVAGTIKLVYLFCCNSFIFQNPTSKIPSLPPVDIWLNGYCLISSLSFQVDMVSLLEQEIQESRVTDTRPILSPR